MNAEVKNGFWSKMQGCNFILGIYFEFHLNQIMSFTHLLKNLRKI